MKIIYDMTRLVNRLDAHHPTGIDRVDINYLQHFKESSAYELVGVIQSNGRLVKLESSKTSLICSQLYDAWCGGKPHDLNFLTRKKADILTTRVNFVRRGAYFENVSLIDPRLKLPSNSQSVTYFNSSHHGLLSADLFAEMKFRMRCKMVFFLHDLIPINFPEYVRAGDSEQHKQRILNIADFADLVLVNSEATKGDYERFLLENRVSGAPAQTVYIGAEDSFLKNESEKVSDSVNRVIKEGPYVLYIGTIEARKNHALLLQIWRDFMREGEPPGRLVIVGKRGWEAENVFSLLDRRNWKGYVIELFGVSDSEMIALLENCKGVLFPSFSEGWGMPLVEALAKGKPAICSDIPVLREASSDCAHYIHPCDAIGWQREISRLFYDAHFEEHLVAKAAAFEAPRWSSAFNKVDNLLGNMSENIRSVRRPRSGSEFSGCKKEKDLIAVTSVNHSQSRFMTFVLSERQHRKIEKFRKSPVRFLRDSRIPLLKSLGNFLARG